MTSKKYVLVMKIIAANFKMNGDSQFISNWFDNFSIDTENFVLVGLPALYLESAVKKYNKQGIKIAAQNVSNLIIQAHIQVRCHLQC